MPAGLQHFTDAYMGKDAQLHLLPSISTGATIDLEYKDNAWITLGAGTYKLPDNQKLGVTVNVYATGAVTITNAAGAVVATLASGDVAKCEATTSTTWVANISKTNALSTNTGIVGVPLPTVLKQDGTVMAKQATTVTGFSQLANKNIVIHIPANSTAESFAFVAMLPVDADTSAAVTVTIYASKTADNDALTFDLELYGGGSDPFELSADLYSGSAVTIEEDGAGLDYACSAPNGRHLHGVITLGGTNDGDVTYIQAIDVSYTKKLLTA